MSAIIRNFAPTFKGLSDMMVLRRSLMLLFTLLACAVAVAQTVTIGGRVVDADTDKPIEFASVLLSESGLWAITGEKGTFTIKGVPKGKVTITVQCLGYQKRTMTTDITHNIDNLNLRLRPDNLKLDEVTVVAKRKHDEATTSYTIDRTTLDQQQMLNLGDIGTLLPGGKTVNPSLMNDQRLALRSSTQEKGNASFGTAIEVDGIRMDNNALKGETMGASTRTISSSNIESVEIVTGIPSVEYGDLSNGIVKVNTRRGKSPFVIEGKLNQHTRQIAVNKGFDLTPHHAAVPGASPQGSHLSYGILNVSMEHARSFSNPASPHTAYQRNILSLHYMNIFLRESTPLTLNMGLTGNIGGYNSEADPDNELEDYSKARDNALRGNLDLQWLLNKRWITNLQFSASFNYADRRTEDYTHTSSASTQPYLHTTEEGYYMAQPTPSPSPREGSSYSSSADDSDNKTNQTPLPWGGAGGGLILGPTGYWYVLGFNDSKPLSWSTKLKADWTRRFGSMTNRLMVGAQYNGSRNAGRGTYYDDMAVAPTWREYRYDELPTMHNVALYAEDKIIIPTSRKSQATPMKVQSLELTAGVREDITMIVGEASKLCGSSADATFGSVANDEAAAKLGSFTHYGTKLGSFTHYGTVSSLSPRANARYIFWRDLRRRWVSDLNIHAGWGKSVKLPSFQVLYPSPSYSDLLVFASTSTQDNTSYYAYHTYPSRAQYNPDLKWQYTNQTDLGVELTVKGTRISLSAFHHKTYRSYMATKTYTPFTYRYTNQSAVQQSGITVADRLFTIDRQSGVVTVHDASGVVPSKELPYTDKHTYVVNQHYINATPLSRYGLEWIIDFAQIRALHTSLRIDGNYYYYKGIDDVFFADVPLGISNVTSSGQPYQYIGYYRGTNVTGAGTSASANVSNGSLQKQLNLNATLTTHIPRLRMVMSLRFESSLYNYRRQLSEFSDGTRGFMLEDGEGYIGEPYDGKTEDKMVVVWPDYYSTWENPQELLPFAEAFLAAKENDQKLYNDLSQLVVRSNFPYTLNPNRLSAYYSANLSVTKEIGDHISVSFYANNFFNNMRKVHSSQTDLDTSLFGSSYIPSYYYGLSLRLKI